MRRVLAIDGGGIRGLLPATLLAALEQREGRPAGELFDLVSGTSTGGIIACGLAAGVSASALVDLYRKRGPAIFARSFWRRFTPGLYAKYSAATLEDELGILGTKRLASKLKAELLVPAYATQLPFPIDLDGDGVEECASSFFFKSWKARQKPLWDFELRRVCRATSAAPTYFPAARISNVMGDMFTFVDGGLFANNPALCAWAAARELWPSEEIRVISLGTGTRVSAMNARDWGVAPWIRHIFEAFMDGAADTVSYACSEILGGKFVRCEMALPPGFDAGFDKVTPDNMAALVGLADGFTDKFLGAL